SSPRRRRSQGTTARRSLRRGEPLHQRSDADHDRDTGRRDGELHRDATKEFVEDQVPQHREQDTEAEDMEGVTPADNEGARGPAAQKPAPGKEQDAANAAKRRFLAERKPPQARFSKKKPTGPRR